MKLIALLTDFGYGDPYVAQMLGVMKSIAPDSEFIHITHNVPPQNIAVAHFLLRYSVDYFPDGTVFLVVVDPGVGSERLPIMIATERFYFVGPDNGLFSRIGEWASPVSSIRYLTNSKYYRTQKISHSFHGRDIFSPVAAWLSNGVPLDKLGPVMESTVSLTLPLLTETADGLEASLIYIDHFGNLMFNFSREEWTTRVGNRFFRIDCGEWQIDCLSENFQQKTPLIAHFNSFQLLEIAVPNGNAARLFGLEIGDEFSISLHLLSD